MKKLILALMATTLVFGGCKQNQETQEKDFLGSWQPSDAGYEEITLDAEGLYYNHLHARPFDSGSWKFDGKTLRLDSDAGEKMDEKLEFVSKTEDQIKFKNNNWTKIKVE